VEDLPYESLSYTAPPHYDYIATSYAKLLTECFTEYTNNHKYMHLIVGDFNLPYINWDVPFGPDDDIYKVVLDFFLRNGYSQLVHFPTRGHNLLDLLLTDADMLVASVASHPPVGLSDHVTIIFSVDIAFEAETAKCTTKKPKITRKY